MNKLDLDIEFLEKKIKKRNTIEISKKTEEGEWTAFVEYLIKPSSTYQVFV